MDGLKSFIFAVISGVPQGSVLGPILFLIFVNDIDLNIDSSLKCFADDTRITHAISGHSDSQKLQDDLNKVMDWAVMNNMELNEDKFEFLKNNYHFDPLLTQLPFTHFDNCYKTANGTLIEPTECVKDLGVTFSSDSTFDTHIATIVKSATSKASWVLSVISSRGECEMMFLYKTYVRPHLEYCCPLWNPSGPNSIMNIKKLEAVQRSFTSRNTSTIGKD